MSAAAARQKPSQTPSFTGVFDRLLADIVTGRYPAGSRLPAERELAVQLATSRPTLREALRRLGEWRLVEPRRGSGIVVRPARDWSFDVLPAYVRLAATRGGPDGFAGGGGGGAAGAPSTEGPDALARLVVDMLGVRRTLMIGVVAQVAGRLRGKSLAAARGALADAWAHRADVPEFVRRDYEILRAIVEAARFLPALWLLNDLSGVYLEIARTITGQPPPDDYLDVYQGVLDALEEGRGADATSALGAYLDRHDKRLFAAMGIKHG